MESNHKAKVFIQAGGRLFTIYENGEFKIEELNPKNKWPTALSHNPTAHKLLMLDVETLDDAVRYAKMGNILNLGPSSRLRLFCALKVATGCFIIPEKPSLKSSVLILTARKQRKIFDEYGIDSDEFKHAYR